MGAPVIHHVFANRSNIGDWMAARGIQALLRPLLPDHTVVEHLCDEPFVPGTLAALAHAGPHDLIVIGGGGLFMDYFTPFWQGFAPLAERLPFCIWGVGHCDLKQESSRAPRALLEATIVHSRLCVVRDELTRSYLPGCKLPSPVPCPSMNLLHPPQTPTRGLLHVDNYTTVGAAAYDAMESAGQTFATNTDRAFHKTNNRIQRDDAAALSRMLDLYTRADLVLSSGLHGCIFAVALGRRILAVSGDTKIDAFMHAAGLGAWVLDPEQVDNLPARLATLDKQPWPQEFVHTAQAANRAVARAASQIAQEVAACAPS